MRPPARPGLSGAGFSQPEPESHHDHLLRQLGRYEELHGPQHLLPALRHIRDAAGVLSISAGKTWAQYAAVSFAADEGRGFHLAKITAGTDGEAESYDVFCSAAGPAGDSCECKAWLYRQTCKHRDACRAVLANGWM